MPGTTRRTAAKAAAAQPKYTLGANRAEFGLQDVTLPSGATCQARRPGVAGMLAAGVLDSFDELTALVQTEHIAPQTPKGRVAAARKVSAEQVQDASAEFAKDPKKLLTALHMIDRLLAYVITQPAVWIGYQLKDEASDAFAARQAKAEQEGAFDLRDMDLGDKMFLMNWAMGGVSELKTFRKELDGLMGPVAPFQAVPQPAKRAPRRRG